MHLVCFVIDFDWCHHTYVDHDNAHGWVVPFTSMPFSFKGLIHFPRWLSMKSRQKPAQQNLKDKIRGIKYGVMAIILTSYNIRFFLSINLSGCSSKWKVTVGFNLFKIGSIFEVEHPSYNSSWIFQISILFGCFVVKLNPIKTTKWRKKYYIAGKRFWNSFILVCNS